MQALLPPGLINHLAINGTVYTALNLHPWPRLNFPQLNIKVFTCFFPIFCLFDFPKSRHKKILTQKPSFLHFVQVGEPQKKFIIIIFMRSNSKKEIQKAPQCTICMQRPSNSTIDGCTHQFCLRCIKRWARTKNNCPLCRQRFLKIQTKNRTIQVEPIPERIRPSRPPLSIPQQPQRTIFYLPLLVYPQQNCFLYPGQSGFFMPAPINNMPSTTYPFGLPSFFIPQS